VQYAIKGENNKKTVSIVEQNASVQAA